MESKDQAVRSNDWNRGRRKSGYFQVMETGSSAEVNQETFGGQ